MASAWGWGGQMYREKTFPRSHRAKRCGWTMLLCQWVWLKVPNVSVKQLGISTMMLTMDRPFTHVAIHPLTLLSSQNVRWWYMYLIPTINLNTHLNSALTPWLTHLTIYSESMWFYISSDLYVHLMCLHFSEDNMYRIYQHLEENNWFKSI